MREHTDDLDLVRRALRRSQRRRLASAGVLPLLMVGMVWGAMYAWYFWIAIALTAVGWLAVLAGAVRNADPDSSPVLRGLAHHPDELVAVRYEARPLQIAGIPLRTAHFLHVTTRHDGLISLTLAGPEELSAVVTTFHRRAPHTLLPPPEQ